MFIYVLDGLKSKNAKQRTGYYNYVDVISVDIVVLPTALILLSRWSVPVTISVLHVMTHALHVRDSLSLLNFGTGHIVIFVVLI